MEEKIAIQHPEGKKAVNMSLDKYEPVKTAILKSLSDSKSLTHKELQNSVVQFFSDNGIKFPGSVSWHMEWVKLDLEAKNQIKRTGDKSPQRYTLV